MLLGRRHATQSLVGATFLYLSVTVWGRVGGGLRRQLQDTTGGTAACSACIKTSQVVAPVWAKRVTQRAVEDAAMPFCVDLQAEGHCYGFAVSPPLKRL